MPIHSERTFSTRQIAATVGGTLYGNADLQVKGIDTDSRKIKPGMLFLALHGEQEDAHRYIPSAIENGAVCIIADRKTQVPDTVALVTVPDTLFALGALAKEHKATHPVPTVGITGSVGKTTTRQLTAAVLSKKYRTLATDGNFNNEIGLPLTLFRLRGDEERAVLEMGMSFAGEMHRLSAIAQPDTAVITCIGTAHIGNLGSREGIRDAKLEIIHGMKPGSVLLIPDCEPLLSEKRAEIEEHGIRVMTVGETADADFRLTDVSVCENETVFSVTVKNGGGTMCDLRIGAVGRHIAIDGAFACAVGFLNGMTPDEIRAGLCDYAPVGMRQKMAVIGGITEIIDCYNASAESMRASLCVLKDRAASDGGRAIAVLGDMLELGAQSAALHESVGTYAAGYCDVCVCVGCEAKKIAEGAVRAGMPESRVFLFPDKDAYNDVAAALCEIVKKGDIILFKASRGMQFERIVEAFDKAREAKGNQRT